MVACSSFQRAAGRASVRAFMVMYGSFWSPAAHCIVLEAYLVAGGPVCELIWLIVVPSSVFPASGGLVYSYSLTLLYRTCIMGIPL